MVHLRVHQPAQKGTCPEKLEEGDPHMTPVASETRKAQGVVNRMGQSLPSGDCHDCVTVCFVAVLKLTN